MKIPAGYSGEGYGHAAEVRLLATKPSSFLSNLDKNLHFY
mgnify:CR=1 FL=1